MGNMGGGGRGACNQSLWRVLGVIDEEEETADSGMRTLSLIFRPSLSTVSLIIFYDWAQDTMQLTNYHFFIVSFHSLSYHFFTVSFRCLWKKVGVGKGKEKGVGSRVSKSRSVGSTWGGYQRGQVKGR